MAQQERWDVVLEVKNGPQAPLGEQVYRGPVVRIGSNPGPGGMRLQGYRGLDARQCVITAYDGSTISVAPVGNNQVRMAPHANVSWKDIDPIRGPEYLSKGAAIHLGPIGRGATLEFVECRRLGVWQQGDLASEVAGSSADGPSSGGPIPPQAYDARRVRQVRTSNAPFWFLGCTFLMTTFTAVSLVAMGAILFLNQDVAGLGPTEPGYDLYDSVDLDTTTIDEDLLEGLQRPFFEFVMSPNNDAAGGSIAGIDNPETWDPIFLQYTTASVEQHVRAWKFFGTLDKIKREYGEVVMVLRQENLPEVFAAIPYKESLYQSGVQSVTCAMGYWQFMPEVAYRVERQGGVPIKVRDCRFAGAPDVKWSPTEMTPPPNVRETGPYMEGGQCRITGCDVDERQNLVVSTKAAAFTLGEAWKDPKIRKSGAAVQLTIASHNTGYDDRRFNRKKPSNVKPALERYAKKFGPSATPHIYGNSITCRNHEDPGRCGSVFYAETQHYVYPIVARHILAVCYYAMNYGEDRAFEPWTQYYAGDGYCKQFKIPSKNEVRKHRGG